jgi:hypothetical protein
VNYVITKVVPAPSGGDIFKLVHNDDGKTASIIAARDLKGLYGSYVVTIKVWKWTKDVYNTTLQY